MMIIAFSKICQVQMYRLFFLFNKQIIFFYLIILFFLGGLKPIIRDIPSVAVYYSCLLMTTTI